MEVYFESSDYHSCIRNKNLGSQRLDNNDYIKSDYQAEWEEGPAADFHSDDSCNKIRLNFIKNCIKVHAFIYKLNYANILLVFYSITSIKDTANIYPDKFTFLHK